MVGGGNVWLSLGVFVISCAVMVYAILAFAHVRITDADMTELERLRNEGLLPAEAHLIEDFRLVHRKLAEIAPTVCMRQEFWLQLYFHLLRLMLWAGRGAATGRATLGAMDRELLRLSAYQAGQFRVALTRLDAIRNPII